MYIIPEYFKDKFSNEIYRKIYEVVENTIISVHMDATGMVLKLPITKNGCLTERWHPNFALNNSYEIFTANRTQEQFDEHFEEITISEWLKKLGNDADKDGPSWIKFKSR